MLRIFNTLGREQQVFNPIEEGKVKIYQCGPTVYWTQHIGNMRAMVIADLIRRSLMYLGNDVRFVRNYTDFGHLTGDNIGDADTGEDRMEKAAKRENLTPKEIADKYIIEFDNDVKSLNTLDPTIKARATDYIGEMIQMVQELLEKAYAYETPEAIYFDVTKFSAYTKLSNQNLEMNKEGEGHGEITKTSKRNPSDFALWFFRAGPHSNALQYWPSPFKSSLVESGYGFPGWHIECSAMVRKTLGNTIDIHMGGIEHIPTHHTNEIAQSESANGSKYVNYWVHNEHLLVDGSKMAKSEGTSYSLSDLIQKGIQPIHLRFFFLQSHYRSKQNFTFDAVNASKTAYERLINLVDSWAKEASHQSLGNDSINPEFKQKFIDALEDDFNIPQALAIVWELTKSELSNSIKLNTILDFDKVLGLNLSLEIENPKSLEIPAEAKVLIEERNIARINKDWAKSDALRDRLANEFGLRVKDGADGQSVENL